ncbi:MAG TPA: hypothetical protein VJM33_15145 [Microthrixaceae bacterium]|nr:hypothetical protein [Microthrixaceae bacterium]
MASREPTSNDVEHDSVVRRYVELGLRLGRHVDGFVDAYYGPPEWRARIDTEPPAPPESLRADARRLVADLDAGVDPDVAGQRRRWLRAQVLGLLTSARTLAGEPIDYVDEVEASYGVRPTRVDEEEIERVHRRLDESLAGDGAVRDRIAAFREAHVIPVDRLRPVIDDIAEDFRDRTRERFGLPEGEHVEFELVEGQPWSGFNYYLGGLRSRVAINTDLPVISTSIGHLVAHEAYPGHHTEHTRKEVGLVRRAGQLEESIFLVGTPQCVVAEGLADLGIEVLLGDSRDRVMSEHLRAHHVTYDIEAVQAVAEFGEMSSRVRGNLGLLLHEDDEEPEAVVEYAQRWLLTDRARAEKAVEFQTDPTWRAYISCYIEGITLCRGFVAGDDDRYDRLLTEQLLPEDLSAGPGGAPSPVPA